MFLEIFLSHVIRRVSTFFVNVQVSLLECTIGLMIVLYKMFGNSYYKLLRIVEGTE